MTDAKMTHIHEQAAAGLRDFARTFGAYMAALLEAGFTREEAFRVVLQYQANLQQSVQRAAEDDR